MDDVKKWRRRTMVLSAVLAVALVAGAALVHSRMELNGRLRAEKDATAAAGQIVTSWLTYDYRSYRRDMKWVTTSGTPRFRKEFSGTALEAMRKKIVGPRQLISRGRVVNSAATAKDSDHVSVLLFTDQRLTDKQMRRRNLSPLHARSGVQLSMVRSGSRWLLDDLTQLQFQ